jgi:basic membrane protein A
VRDLLRKLILGFALTMVLSLPAAGGAAGSQLGFKAAWMYVGPHDDRGWSEAHDRGRLYVLQKLSSRVQTTFKENVPEGPQAAQVIESLIRDGNKIIFATSFGYQSIMRREAKKHPDVYFEQKGTGLPTTRNLAQFYGAGEDSIYLAGMAAGAATKNGTVGYIVSFPIRELIIHANAFALGVRRVRPHAKVKLLWTSSWFDPAKERLAAVSLVASGADVIGQNVDSPAAGQFAESRGIPWVGYDSDARRFAPNSWLTAAVYNWGPYYLRRVRAAIRGSWKTGSYYGSIKDGFTDIAPFGSRVVPKTKTMIRLRRAELISRRFYEFTGPLYDQNAKLRVPKGHRLTLKELWSMNWLVQGVVGSRSGS